MFGTLGATHRAVTTTRNRAAHLGVTLAALAVVGLVSLACPKTGSAQRLGRSLRERPSAARELAEPFAPEPSPRETALDLHAGTLAPLLIGGGMRVSLPAQLVVGVLAGGVPDAYAEVFSGAADAYGAGPGVSELVRQFFSGAFALRIEAGVRPVVGQGFELLAHYTALIAEPVLSTASIDELAGQPLPWEGTTSLRMNGVLHGFGGELGWAISPFDGLVIRLSLGLTYFAAAGVRLQVPQSMRTTGGPVEQAEQRIASTFTTYGVVPYASVLAGWRIE